MKSESIEDILREMRDAAHRNKSAIADYNHLCSDWYYDHEVQDWLTAYAERIEAALQREYEALRNLVGDIRKSADSLAVNASAISATNSIYAKEIESAISGTEARHD